MAADYVLGNCTLLGYPGLSILGLDEGLPESKSSHIVGIPHSVRKTYRPIVILNYFTHNVSEVNSTKMNDSIYFV